MSLALSSDDAINKAKDRLESLGLKVTFGKNAKIKDENNSSSVEERIQDLHEAFADKNVKMILTARGGSNCNQLLSYIDYDLIKNNPKIFMGYSDITALCNAIYAKTELVTYMATGFSGFSKDLSIDYTIEYFQKCLMQNDEYQILPSKTWSDEWVKDENGNVKVFENEGFWSINNGTAQGKIIGGNINTLRLLYGTDFMPKFDSDTILFLEDDSDTVLEHMPAELDRNLQSLIHQPGFENIKGLVFGRFQTSAKITREILTQILLSKKELKNLPIIANVDFGTTSP